MERFGRAPAPVKKKISLNNRRRTPHRDSSATRSRNPHAHTVGDQTEICNYLRKACGEDFAYLCVSVEREVNAIPTRASPATIQKAYRDSPHMRLLTDKKISEKHQKMVEEHSRLFSTQEVQRQYDVEQVAMHLIAERRRLTQLRRDTRQARL